ncbi:hypothetical protein [Cylindrospermum sp. FACHB-282]|uniref:hypothetical protein n=1 Tax=Cylindrospermum sp. FACHB-282 TaxID=2692794 RepID=UPI00168533B3|nr:hypothetical protein [Cylindrospermum sp. FACHB-282]MBD2387257.1 hypothetical protein [Cylindrospermum sp. FACHB-282]
MKRAISFLTTLMFAFVVAFGFVVNTASANILTCHLSAVEDCVKILEAHDELDLFFKPLSNLNVTFQNITARQTAQVAVTIGSQVQQPAEVNLQPGEITEQIYETIGATAAVLRNDSVTRPSSVKVTVTLSSITTPPDEPAVELPVPPDEPAVELPVPPDEPAVELPVHPDEPAVEPPVHPDEPCK